jgi:uncharacterized hydrophobic protein (TIGR00271 family)
MSTTVVVLLDPADLPVLPWAARLATATGRPLRVLCVSVGDARQARRVAADAVDEETPPLVTAALESVAAMELRDAQVMDCRGPDLRRVVLDTAGELEAQVLVLAAPVDETDDGRRAVIRRVARAAPDDVLLLDVGSLGVAPPARIVVPQIGGGGAHALRLATRGLGAGEAPVVAIPDLKKAARSRRVFERVRGRKPSARAERLTRIDAPPGSMRDAIAAVLEPGDLVLVDAEQAAQVPKIVSFLQKLRSEREDMPFAVAVARAEDATGPGRFERAIERLRVFAPALSRDERKALHERIESGGKLSTDFVVMLTLSAAIAALGLVQNSAAVVIGAMLVAPLMTPLVAAGLSLVHANFVMFRAALRAVLIGVSGAFLVSFVIGILSPWDDLSAEVIARGGPNLFDLGIAGLSGMAAAYALARPGLAGTLVGVAIAVALVPPLSAAGIATAKGQMSVAIGAAVLFATNFLAIIGGAAVVFRFFGLQVSRHGDDSPRWVRAVLVSLVIGLLATSAPLVHNLSTQMKSGVSRPYVRPLPLGLRESITARLDERAGVAILMMAISDMEPGLGVEITLVCTGPAPDGLAAELTDLVKAAMGEAMPVRVTMLRAAE